MDTPAPAEGLTVDNLNINTQVNSPETPAAEGRPESDQDCPRACCCSDVQLAQLLDRKRW